MSTDPEPPPPHDTTAEQARPPFAHGTLMLGLAGEDSLRWAVTDLTAIVEDARHRLDLFPVPAAALGRTMAGAVLLLRLAVKTPSRLVVEVRGDGPLIRIVAEADDQGNLRGMVGDPHVAVPRTVTNKLAVGAAVGSEGLLRVTRESEGSSYSSQVALVSGEIGEDLAHYLDQSEQTRSAVLLGVLARQNGIAAAGGLVIEAMPGASEAVITRLEENLAALPGFSRLLEETGSLQAALEMALAGLGPRIVEEKVIHYSCRCSPERLKRHLILLSHQGEQLLAPEKDEVVAECSFCGAEYRFSAEEILRSEPSAS